MNNKPVIEDQPTETAFAANWKGHLNQFKPGSSTDQQWKQEPKERSKSLIRELSGYNVVSLAISHVCRKRQYDQRQGQHKINVEDDYTLDESFLFMVTNNVIPLEEWYINSGCSNHMTNQREWFDNPDENFTMKIKETLQLQEMILNNVQGKGTIPIKLSALRNKEV